MSPRRAMIDRIVRTQHGVISRAQAVDEAGCTEGYIAARLRSGEWERAAPGIFMVRSVEPTWRTSLMAACLSLGAVASHRSAARVWDIDGFDNDGPEVTIARAGGRGRAGVIVHESTQTEDMEVVIIDNIPCTSAARTILDLGAVIGPRRLEWAIDDVLRRGIVEIPDLEQVLRRHSRRGRNGCGPLRQVLEERSGEERTPDSKWNRMAARLLVQAGLPRPEFEHPVQIGGRSYRIDLAYPAQKVAIELDSVRWHLNRESFDADPVRRNALTLAGWNVLTFTYRVFREDPQRLCRSVRLALQP